VGLLEQPIFRFAEVDLIAVEEFAAGVPMVDSLRTLVHLTWLSLETVLTVIAVTLALLIGPRLRSNRLRSFKSLFFRLARHRRASVLAVFLLAILVRCAVLHRIAVPYPYFHDEFSYMLAGDTFASGRLTNPPHPMWVHFESMHIIQQPTYMSMYPPAQGIVLAAGQLLTGKQWTGVLFSVALMCAVICWMLQQWLPPAWALLGGLLAVLRFDVSNYWVDSYWGGAVAAFGGALALGSLPRIMRYRHARDAILLGIGLVVMAASRPYEGCVLSLPIAVALMVWLTRKSAPPFRVILRRIILPASLVLVLGAGWMAYYFWRVTGNPFLTPYHVDSRQYGFSIPLIWAQPSPPVQYHHAVMAEFYRGMMMQGYREAREHAITGPTNGIIAKLKVYWVFFLGPGPLLSLPILMHPLVLRDRRIRFLSATLGIMLLGLLLEVWPNPHYAAPATAAIYAVILQGLRHLRAWPPRSSATGYLLAWSVPVILITLVCIHYKWYKTTPDARSRLPLEVQLEQVPGRHLVVVRYHANHDVDYEWVYNRADIDNARIVWARDMGRDGNLELLRYFKDRTVWLAEPNDACDPRHACTFSPPHLSLYSP
jgi:hypothetical protein